MEEENVYEICKMDGLAGDMASPGFMLRLKDKSCENLPISAITRPIIEARLYNSSRK
jgi:hypothetical protein